MTEDQLYQVSALLEEVVGSEGGRKPSDAEVCAVIWEACGASGVLQMLVDLLNTKVMDLEEGTGSEESDVELLQKAFCSKTVQNGQSMANGWGLTQILYMLFCMRSYIVRIKSENDSEFDAIKAVKEGRLVLFTVEVIFTEDHLQHHPLDFQRLTHLELAMELDGHVVSKLMNFLQCLPKLESVSFCKGLKWKCNYC